MCISCGLCGCGEIKNLCQKKGYQFYITPSVGFTKRLVRRRNIKGVIGAACSYEIKKGVKKEKVSSKGLTIDNNKVVPLAVYMPTYNCTENSIDWDKLKKMIEEI